MRVLKSLARGMLGLTSGLIHPPFSSVLDRPGHDDVERGGSLTIRGVQQRAELESVVGATPHEFESRILRQSEQGSGDHVPQVRAWFPHSARQNDSRAGRYRDRPASCKVSIRVSSALLSGLAGW